MVAKNACCTYKNTHTNVRTYVHTNTCISPRYHHNQNILEMLVYLFNGQLFCYACQTKIHSIYRRVSAFNFIHTTNGQHNYKSNITKTTTAPPTKTSTARISTKIGTLNRTHIKV